MVLKRYRINEIVIYICILLISADYVLWRSIDNWEYRMTTIFLTCSVLLLNLFISKNKLYFNKKEIYIIIYLLLGTIISTKNFLNLDLIYLICLNLYIFSTQRKVKRNLFLISVISLLLVFFLLFSGISENTVITQFGRTRNTLGFSNTNSLGIIFVSIYSFSFITKKRWYNNLFVLVAAYIFYLYTDSRTPFLMAVTYQIILFGILLINKVKMKSKIYKIIIILIFILSFTTPFILRKMPGLDTLFSMRLSIFNNFINDNLISFFVGFGRSDGIDNSFLVLTSIIGIYGIIFFIRHLFHIIDDYLKKEKLNELAFLIAFLSSCLMEVYLIIPEMMVTIYFWYLLICEIKNKKKRSC